MQQKLMLNGNSVTLKQWMHYLLLQYQNSVTFNSQKLLEHWTLNNATSNNAISK